MDVTIWVDRLQNPRVRDVVEEEGKAPWTVVNVDVNDARFSIHVNAAYPGATARGRALAAAINHACDMVERAHKDPRQIDLLPPPVNPSDMASVRVLGRHVQDMPNPPEAA